MRLLIADDHALFRAGLLHLFQLAPDIEVVGEASNGAQVLERLQAGGVDLLLLDLQMPGNASPCGTELIARIRTAHPKQLIVALSMCADSGVAHRALKAGAAGYLTKDQEPQALLADLRKVAGGGRAIAPALAEALAFDGHEDADPFARLSQRELQTLELLVSGDSINEIAGKLSISAKTVSSHKAKLMEKMGFNSFVDLLRYALAHGMR
ncbi:MAG: response regulator transcription factor [Burkholderiaceae bacterium]